ncbi:MAG: AMMECR1 domain-containing protein [Deltaproteobacteria bacterium]|nr:AMMECR1 domain-containing protein [Candidatus Zymogenaceae bacterium]
MNPFITRRTFVGAMVSSAYLITSRPVEATAALTTPDFVDQDKRRILDYVFALIDHSFDKTVGVVTPVLSHRFSGDEFKMVWVAFLKDRKVIACKGRTVASPGTGGAFLAALKTATTRSLQDNRFIDEIGKKDVGDLELVVHINRDIVPLRKTDLSYLKKKIEPGVHAFKLELDGKHAWYLENVPITANWGLETSLKKLSKKAGLPSDAYKDPRTKISMSEMLTFKGKRTGVSHDLYRYSILVSDEDMSNELIHRRLALARDWFLNNVDPKTKRINYLYYPVTNKYSKDTNEVRNLAVLYILPELNDFLGDDSLGGLIRGTTDHYMTKIKQTGDYSYLDLNGDAKIPYNAFMILSLIRQPDYPGALETAGRLADGIVSLQRPDGSYVTSFDGKVSGIDYYPGEAMLSLMRLFDVTGDTRLAESVAQAFPYYRDYWRRNKNTAFIPWHTQTYFLLARHKKDAELESFVYEMNDWLINTYQIFRDAYPDKIGGFKKENPGNSTASYMEGINDAYRTARLFENKRHSRKYRNSIENGMRFVLQTQFTPENAFWVKNPKRAVGGFRASLRKVDLRNDYTQHATSALIKAYRNDIF